MELPSALPILSMPADRPWVPGFPLQALVSEKRDLAALDASDEFFVWAGSESAGVGLLVRIEETRRAWSLRRVVKVRGEALHRVRLEDVDRHGAHSTARCTIAKAKRPPASELEPELRRLLREATRRMAEDVPLPEAITVACMPDASTMVDRILQNHAGPDHAARIVEAVEIRPRLDLALAILDVPDTDEYFPEDLELWPWARREALRLVDGGALLGELGFELFRRAPDHAPSTLDVETVFLGLGAIVRETAEMRTN